MTKQLELKRISDVVIAEISVGLGQLGSKKIADIQLQEDQQVLDNVKQAIFDEIEKRQMSYGTIIISHEGWQALKKKWGVKE